jgi:hypothetical protein
MTTEEKIQLLNDAEIAIQALGILMDGGRQIGYVVPEQVRNDCRNAMAALTMVKLQLVAEVGTDNL